MPRKPSQELISTAYHEAGHAVAAWRSGIGIKHVTIIPDNEAESAGHIKHQALPKAVRDALEFDSPTPTQRAKVENYIVMFFAGGIAERKYKGRSNHIGAHGDMRAALDVADRLCGSIKQTEAFTRWLYVCALDMVDTFWPKIEVVAQALLERQTLTGKEVRDIITPPYRGPVPSADD